MRVLSARVEVQTVCVICPGCGGAIPDADYGSEQWEMPQYEKAGRVGLIRCACGTEMDLPNPVTWRPRA